MWGWVSAAAVAAVLAVGIVGVTDPEPAAAVHGGKSCGIVTKKSHDYRVRAQKLECDKAMRGAKRYLRKGKALDGFSCGEPDGRTEFFCKNGTKVYWAVRL
jgi:hypothetical protein